MVKKPTIYFVCTHNSCRSQMAEGFTKAKYGNDFHVFSGGLYARGVHPFAIRVMQEKGIDISTQTSDRLDTAILMKADIVITLCKKAEDTCPSLPPNVITFHWGIEDPTNKVGTEGELLPFFRTARDEIEKKVVGMDRIFQRVKSGW